jgi:hypothetical protein
MQPLKMIIYGQFWDSQIYAGRLYLFTLNGEIITVDWDALLSKWPLEKRLRVALVAAFLRSDFLYGADLFALFRDPDIRRLIQQKFELLAAHALEIDLSRTQGFVLGTQNNPFPFPHADSEIYRRVLYVGSTSGLALATVDQRTRLPVSTRVVKRFDAPVLGLSLSYDTVAMAAGSDGLFEAPAGASNLFERVRLTVNQPCEDCNWTYYSIFASSSMRRGYLAEYSRSEGDDFKRFARNLEQVRQSTEIFGRPGYSWGVHDKICQASDGKVEIARYRPWLREKEPNEALVVAGEIDALQGSQDIVAASTAAFGTIIEYSNSLVIHSSDGVPLALPGEPVKWRIFSRSKHYGNQLHVVYSDRLEILSFNHDYLLDQDVKLLGTRVMRSKATDARPVLDLMDMPD